MLNWTSERKEFARTKDFNIMLQYVNDDPPEMTIYTNDQKVVIKKQCTTMDTPFPQFAEETLEIYIRQRIAGLAANLPDAKLFGTEK